MHAGPRRSNGAHVGDTAIKFSAACAGTPDLALVYTAKSELDKDIIRPLNALGEF
jgi:hypothetical protein